MKRAPKQGGRTIRQFIRTNYKIRVPQVRVLGANGEMLGVMQTRDAQRVAQEQGLDLVEISPTAEPPVCRIMDFGKYRYEESRKQRVARKNQHAVVIKEMKFHANVGEHDYATKLNHTREFLEKGFKVKITLVFRGRENAHRELGFAVVSKLIKDCADVSVVESEPRVMGKCIFSMLGGRPSKPGQKDQHHKPAHKPSAPAQARPAPVVRAAPVVPSPVPHAAAPASAPAQAPAAIVPQVGGQNQA